MPDGAAAASAKMKAATKANSNSEANTFAADQKSEMFTSWPSKPKSEWNAAERFLAAMNVMPEPPGLPPPPTPVYKVGDPVPVWRKRDQIISIAPWCIVPLGAHWAFMTFTGNTIHPVAAYLWYMFFYQAYSTWQTRRATWAGQKYGHFHGEHPRDNIPDQYSWYILIEVLKVVLIRPMLFIMFVYDRDEIPSVNLLMLPLKMLAWSLVLDFWFYMYHMAMHKVPSLWRFHRKHHLTKHPSSLLSAFADWEQEIFDAYVIPALTYAVLHPWFNFSEIYICSICIVQAEAGGHSGARVYATSVMNGWLLRPLGMELSVEDHDLHHRNGFRHHSANYGKQTLAWDTLMGTKRPRLESADQYVDWNWHVQIPWWVPRRWDINLMGHAKEE